MVTFKYLNLAKSVHFPTQSHTGSTLINTLY